MPLATSRLLDFGILPPLFTTKVIIAFQLPSLHGQGPEPTRKRNSPEQAPGNGLTLRLDPRGEGEEPARDEGADAPAGSGEGLCNPVEGAEAGIRRCRVCNLVANDVSK